MNATRARRRPVALLLAFILVILSFSQLSLAFAADSSALGTSADLGTPVTYTAEQVGGISGVTDSTGILITFSEDVSGLTAGQVTVTGATKGALTNNNDSDAKTWLVGISDLTVANGETVTIDIASWTGVEVLTTAQSVEVFRGGNALVHDLGTGALTVSNNESRDIYVFGSYSGSAAAIRFAGRYNGVITLDNAQVSTSGNYAIDTAYTSTGKWSLNLVGSNTLQAAYFGIYAPYASVTMSGSGSLTSGEIRAKELTVGVPLTISSKGNGVITEGLTVNAPLNVTATGGDGIVVSSYIDGVNAPSPLEINADVTVRSAGSGILADRGIHLNSGDLNVASTGGEYYSRAHGIAWGDGSKNTQAAGTSISSTPGVTSDGKTGFAYAAYRMEPAGKGSMVYIFAQRSSFTDASTGGFGEYEVNDGTVFTQDPAAPPQDLVAVVPQSFLDDYGLTLGNLTFRGDTLDGQTIVEFADDIGLSAYGAGDNAGDPVIRNFIGDMVDWTSSTVWVDLHFVNPLTGEEIHGHCPEGITVYLPFPTGRDASNSDFLLIHKVGGLKIETPSFEITPYGIKFTVYSFSPFALIYKDSASSGGGNGGGAISSGGSSRGSGSSGGTFKADTDRTTGVLNAAGSSQWIEAAKVNALISEAKGSQRNYVSTRSTGSYGIRKAALAALQEYAYQHDTVSNQAVQVRVTLRKPAATTADTLVSGYVSGDSVNKTKAIFQKWYSNKIAVIHFDQSGSWGQTAQIAAKVDLNGVDAKDLAFYSYDRQTNQYKRIATPNARIDSNGYLHFETELAGDIILSEGALTRK